MLNPPSLLPNRPSAGPTAFTRARDRAENATRIEGTPMY